MATPIGFFREAWKRLRSKALAATVDTGEYVILWASLIVAHIVKVIGAAAGADQVIIDAISFMEKWTWIGSFAAFFWRVIVRIWKGK
jgi:hypothetical protein